MKKIRVVIADDHPTFRDGLKLLLEGEPDVQIVGETSSGEEIIKLAKKLLPDIIIMDIRLHGIDGIEATRLVKKDNPQINILVLSMYDDDAHIIEAIQAGANGYLSKLLPSEELLKAIRKVSDEGIIIPQQLMPKLVRSLTGGDRVAKEDVMQKPSELTRGEIKVLQLISTGLSNKEIAGKLFISEKTVKNHLNRIFQKLDVKNRTQAVVYAIDRGLISIEE
ncbi:MAG: response regulator transcription factor [Elusimicrobiota bacterium]